MEPNAQVQTPILQTAWTRYAQLDAASLERSRPHMRLRWWIAALGVLTTLFAVLTTAYPQSFPAIGGLVLKYLLVATPIIGSLLAALVSKLFGGGDWLITRAGAEQILKEIYTYRTILAKEPTRREWLEKRLVDVQREVFRGLGGELALKPYVGDIPPYYDGDDPHSDPGFNDLTGEEYFKYRLENQLAWHTYKLNRFHRERTRLIVFIVLAGAAGAILAAAELAMWVALTASLAAAMVGWQELRNLDQTIKNYSKVVMELGIIHDHWVSMEQENRTDGECFEMVRSAEELLWSQNMEYIRSMQEALANASLEEQASLVNNVVKQAREADARFQQNVRSSILEVATEKINEYETTASETFKTTLSTLAEEASSEIVQQELEAMSRAVVQAVSQGAKHVSDSLHEIAAEFDGVEINPETPSSTLNQVIARYPKSGEIKG